MIPLTIEEARNFILLKQGLLGEYRFTGKQGALDYVRQAGCIQFDPVDACGKNAELTLQSRVKGFTKQTLYELLYEDRSLVDYPDKNISIIPAEDWPYFERYRRAARENGRRFSRNGRAGGPGPGLYPGKRPRQLRRTAHTGHDPLAFLYPLERELGW